jgi:hypothetical protein
LLDPPYAFVNNPDYAGVRPIERQPIGMNPGKVGNVEAVQHSALIRGDLQLFFIGPSNHPGFKCRLDVEIA